jgi:pimeloyl-ACP methyl ester carboxylesterase
MTASIYKSAAGERAVMAFYDEILAHWPVPRQELRVPTRCGETFVIASGAPAAPPLVLLHGAASNALSWMGDVAEYSRHFRVYAVDMPGEPGRSAPTRPDWAGPAYVEWFEDVLAGLHLDRTALLGLSQGGWAALKFAAHRPERVSALILLAPAGVVPDRVTFLLRVIPLSCFGRRGADAINRITFGKQSIHPTAVAFSTLIMTHFRTRIGALPMFTDAELENLTMPTLVIGGAQDAIRTTPKMMARLKRLAPGLAGAVLLDTGHVLVNTTAETIPFLRTALAA